MRLALFQPDIPQNLGASLRLGACLGVPVDVIEPCGFPLSDRAVKRAAMDYAERAEVIRYPGWGDFLARRAPGRLVLFTTRAEAAFHQFEYLPCDTLLFGRESAGVPDEVHAAADARVTIPLVAGARSLNVVTAAAMALAEALRQTDGFPSAVQTG
ncbi:tRNA (cytidine(34)-2'-O)-methyltransferase [Phenylobacterium soli]|uniref:tRNA (cytidine(34)-2'-O)-methyltransferase n=1 Tax=Phenylobacterium soli TaxID=2170551 RepID=A0A328AHP8_9CAUL|nr:TrmH family RNA methyltransferase [Phenylobacterium soli]RAK54280.1 tRNA (cytidine(34)-2'-O)-methyltransferase [Phenylobacterium soli]